MREKWRQARLLLPTLLAFAPAEVVFLLLVKKYHVLPLLETAVGFAIVCVALYLAGVTWFERRAVTELSMHHALSAAGAGALGGIALYSLGMTIFWLAGGYRPEGLAVESGVAFARWLLIAVAFWLSIAIQEELLFRGLIFRLFSKLIGTWGRCR